MLPQTDRTIMVWQNIHAPEVTPVAQRLGNQTRPFWSVMIPTYNPRADYLEETLNSVLQQDPGPEQMQIEVVDDGSLDNTASEVIRRDGADRVAYQAQPKNHRLSTT